MKAFLIDPEKRTITEVDYDGHHKSIYKLIGADLFDTVRLSGSDVIFVDDEGLMKNPQHFFKLDGLTSPLAGKGLVLGTNNRGESISPKLVLLEDLQRWVTFITRERAVTYAEQADEEARAYGKGQENFIHISAAEILKSEK